MSYADDIVNPLRSVMFVPGSYTWLFDRQPHDKTTKLEGVLELLQFANSYVLNDITAMGGLPNGIAWSAEREKRPFEEDDISKFLYDEFVRSDSVEPIGERHGAELDLSQIEEALEINKKYKEFRDFEERIDRNTPGGEEQLQNLIIQNNILQAQSYILLADKVGASYVPERKYGYKALLTYPDTISKSPQLKKPHEATNAFVKKLEERLSKIQQVKPAIHVHVPCFLAEALQSSATPAGIGPSLRDLRDSAAAKNYRSLVREMLDDSKNIGERQEIAVEIEKQSDASFKKEKLGSRVPASYKFTAALSAFAVSFFFPPAAFAAAIPLVIEAGEQVDRWLRNRNNIFEMFDEASNVDLFAELKRLLPHIHFTAAELEAFLKMRNWGFLDGEEREKFLALSN